MFEKRLLSPDSDVIFVGLGELDWVEKGTLIWTEMHAGTNNSIEINGPYQLLTPWCKSLLGTKNNNKKEKNSVKYVDTCTGKIGKITHNTLLFTSIYVLKDDLKQQIAKE